MLLTLIIVACAAFVAVSGFGGYTVVSHRRARRALPEGRGAAPPALRPSPARPPSRPVTPRPAPSRSGPPTRPAGPPTAEAPPADLKYDSGEQPETLAPAPVPAPPPEPEVLEKPRFRDRLGKARSLLASQLAGLRGRSKLDREAWDELEEALVLADVGILTTEELLRDLKQRARTEGLSSPDQVVSALREELVHRLEGDRELHRAGPDVATVWLFVGVNGVGKTTTIGKVAMRETEEGRRVVVAAGDTFRAAAADQLQLWAERVGAGFVRGSEGGDPGAVVFDAVQHAGARGIPLVLADTAGRLHTKVNLMEELKKVRRVADRPPGSVTEVLLVIDATTGQNGLVQARQFTEAVGVTGIVLTKLDGTAKGGIAVAIASELGVPIKLVGLGEGPKTW